MTKPKSSSTFRCQNHDPVDNSNTSERKYIHKTLNVTANEYTAEYIHSNRLFNVFVFGLPRSGTSMMTKIKKTFWLFSPNRHRRPSLNTKDHTTSINQWLLQPRLLLKFPCA